MSVHLLKIAFEVADGEVLQHWLSPNTTNPVNNALPRKKTVALASPEDGETVGTSTSATTVVESPS